VILKIDQSTIAPDIDVFAMSGRLTMGSDSQNVEWNLAKLLQENHKKVIFDLSAVNFLDSSGIGILVMCHAKLKKAGGSLRIAGAQGMVRQIIEMTNVNKLIELYSTSSEASKNFTVA
jgi:anti-sigma B factor antagonist